MVRLRQRAALPARSHGKNAKVKDDGCGVEARAHCCLRGWRWVAAPAAGRNTIPARQVTNRGSVRSPAARPNSTARRDRAKSAGKPSGSLSSSRTRRAAAALIAALLGSRRARRPTATRCWSPPTRLIRRRKGCSRNVPYDPIKDFTPVARIGSFSRPSSRSISICPVRDHRRALVAYAKQNPGKLVYGHGNSTGQIVGEALKQPHRRQTSCGSA